MPDEFDLASEHEALFRNVALSRRAQPGPAAIGVCLNCGDPLPDGMRWCDECCQADWAKRQRALSRGGA